ncbi:MAG: hypothetical protein WC595_00325 [Candidatus Nanoarchaeia archaeon]
MEKNNLAVFDAGPFIHLSEIEALHLTRQFKPLTTEEILDECKNLQKTILEFAFLKDLTPQSKDFSKYLIEEYDLHLGEATGIALCKQEKIKLFFTDDLDARDISKRLGFQAHGTLAIILRAFRESILNKNKTLELLHLLRTNSSLYFTTDLLQWTINQVETYKK